MTKNVNTAEGWNFDNSYARLPQLFFSKIEPTPVRSPGLVVLNEQLATSLGLHAEALRTEEGAAIFAGNRIPEGALPLAQAYAGHQFGHFTMLGDGRAVLLGEQLTPSGERFDIQLKGSGPTPYSRRGDGRAALGPMLREHIISEAMHGLGISTTRSLAVVTTGEAIIRETDLPGAILTRVASSHLRVGTFEYVAQWGTDEELRALADYAIERHYPHVANTEQRYLHFFGEVIKRQAELIAKWQLVGFIHGVMNTDNMTISGETIDYGPCAFMDVYDPATVFSSIDRDGRYAYGNQPNIGGWNLSRLASALLPLFHENHDEAVELAQDALSQYATSYYANWNSGMRAKLGIFNEEAEDESLFKELLMMMHNHRADYTNTFISLTFDTVEDTTFASTTKFADWVTLWQSRLARQEQSKDESHQLMRRSNPAVIPRNHRVEEALEAATERGDYSVMEQLNRALSHPYAHSPNQVVYSTPPGETARSYQTFCGT